MKNLIFFVVSVLAFNLISCTQAFQKAEVKTEDEKNLYVIGTKFGTGVNNLNLSEDEALIVARGFYDASINKKISGLEDAERVQKVQDFLNSRKVNAGVDSKKQGDQFIESFVKEGAKKSPTGLVYKILKEGEGLKPGPNDTVDILIHGTLPNGSVFTSTRGSTQPLRYPLDKIVPGWSEGIQLIAPGGLIKLAIPPELGYGEVGAPPKIPANTTLIMEVELVAITSPKSVKK